MKHTIAIILLATLATGCSIFTTTTPRDNSGVTRYGMDGKGRAVKSDEMRFSNEWLEAAHVENLVIEEFYNPADMKDANGLAPSADYLKRREVRQIRTDMSPTLAAEVAKEKARATVDTADFLSMMIETVGPVVMQGLVSIRNTQEENRTMRREIEALRDVELKKLEPVHHEAPATPAPTPAPVAE